MISKKDLMVAVLATFCVTSLLFVTIPIRSAPGDDGYDPWIDTDDNGIIDYQDLYNLASIYRTSGTPINKTDLLLELNATVEVLLSRVEALEEPVTTERIEDDAVTTDKILNETIVTEDLANGTVTNEKLASGAIPFRASTSTTERSTTSTEYEDMVAYTLSWPLMLTIYMQVTVTVESASRLWIMFSAEAKNSIAQDIWVRAWINDAEAASPNEVLLARYGYYSSYACNFYYYAGTAGTYNIMIQWKVDAGTGYVDNRALAVVALPA